MEKVEKRYMSVRDVANFLGVSPASVRVWIINGDLPAFRSPGGWRDYKEGKINPKRRKGAFKIRREDFEEFLKKQQMGKKS